MYLQIVYAYLYDVFAFDSELTPLQFVGIGILLIFSLASAFIKRFQQDEEKDKEKDVKNDDQSKVDRKDDFERAN